MSMILWPKEKCPRCGGDNLEIIDNGTGGRYWFVECQDCRLRSTYGRDSQHEACVSWDINARKWERKE